MVLLGLAAPAVLVLQPLEDLVVLLGLAGREVLLTPDRLDRLRPQALGSPLHPETQLGLAGQMGRQVRSDPLDLEGLQIQQGP